MLKKGGRMNGDSLNQKLTVLVLGFDPYQDVWPYFDYFFLKNSLGKLKNTIFVSITKGHEDVSDFVNLTTFGKADFSSRLKTGLAFVKTDYVLLLLEDYIVNRSIDYRSLTQIMDEMEKFNYSFCELDNFIKQPKLVKKHQGQGKLVKEIVSPGHYRISLQPALWRKEFLDQLANRQIENPWDFEVLLCDLFDNQKNGEYPKAGASFNGTLEITNFIDKGKLTRSAASLIRKNGLEISARPIQSRFESMRNRVRIKISGFLPAGFRKKIKKI